MSVSKVFISICVLCLAAFTTKADARTKLHYDQYFFDVLKACKEGQFPLALDRLDDLNKRSKYTRFLLVELLDYYLGEGPNELLAQLITEKGKKILPLLVAKRKKGLGCLPKYKSICMNKFTTGLQIRNERIDELIDAIQNGIVLRTEDGT